MSRFFQILRPLAAILFFLILIPQAFAQTFEERVDAISTAIDEERLDDAIADLNAATSNASGDVERIIIAELYGYVYYLQGKLELAAENYDRAIDLLTPMDDAIEELQAVLTSRIHIAREMNDAARQTELEALLAEVEAKRAATLEDVWETNEETGDITYLPANLVFPETAGLFVRERTHMYEEDGTDVSIHYTISDITQKAILTVFVSYYEDMDFDHYLLFSRRDLMARYQGTATIGDEVKFVRPETEDSQEQGYYGLWLHVDDPAQNGNWSNEELWVASVGHWFVKLRFTWKGEYRDEIAPSFFQFLDQVDLGLNDQLLAILTAGREGVEFCPLGSNPYGSGQKLSAKKRKETLVSLMALLPGELAAGPVTPVNCLLETRAMSSGYKMAFFMNTEAPDPLAPSSPVLSLRLYDVGWAPYSDISLDKAGGTYSFLSSLAGKKNNSPEDLYLLTIREEGVINVYDLYDGAPDAESVLNDALTILNGEKDFMMEVSAGEDGKPKVNLNAGALEDIGD